MGFVGWRLFRRRESFKKDFLFFVSSGVLRTDSRAAGVKI